jgi:hypothetical protein
MCILYNKILQQERVMQRYVFGQGEISSQEEASGSGLSALRNPRNKALSTDNSTKFAMQATFYVVVFFFTWCFPMLQTIFSLRSGTLYYPLIMLSAMLSSLQGFSNTVIYLRPRWIRFREKHPDETGWHIIISRVLLSSDAELDQKVTNSFNVIASRQSKFLNDGAKEEEPVVGESGAIFFNGETSAMAEIEPRDKAEEGENEEEDLYME